MQSLPIEQLKEKCTGSVLVKGDPGYDEAAKILIAKGSPAVIVKPKTADDVALAIAFARNNNLTISIKSGGHSVAGFSTNDGGLVIDLSRINDVELLDSEKAVVRVGAGATWKHVGMTLQKHGLALTSGDTTSVGVGGLSLGGGIGWMVRKYGLTIDNLVAAEVISADGSLLRASDQENPDLFWAIRGGGGNFGVVTHFEFIAQRETTVFAGSISYSIDSLPDVLRVWRDCMRNADRELTSILDIMPSFGENPPMVLATVCYAGNTEAAAMAALAPLLSIGNITKKDIKEKPYVDVLEEAHPPEGMKFIVKNVFIPSFSDDVIDSILAAREKRDMIIQIRSLGGAVADVEPNDTAFAHRRSEVMILSPTFLPPTATDDEIKQALMPWNEIAVHGFGAYINFLSTTDQEDVEAAYPTATHERLRKIKQQYDPDNVFSQNLNIQP